MSTATRNDTAAKEFKEAIRAAARDRWPEILPAIDPDLSDACRRVGRHGPCPKHGGKDGFRLFDDGTGGAVCNTCGTFGDGFALLQWSLGISFPQARDRLAAYLGIKKSGCGPRKTNASPATTANTAKPPEAKPTNAETESRERPRINEWAVGRLRTIGSGSMPDDGIISAYLRGRGLSGQVPNALRLHPHLPYSHGEDEGRKDRKSVV